jgi:hypothetical protein
MKNNWSTLIGELSAAGTRKFAAGKKLLVASEKNPDALYPHFDALAAHLSSENKIIRWTVIRIIANLSVVDRRRRIDGILNEYLAPIAGPVMITAANTILGAAKIANAKPHLLPKIVRTILKVERAGYQTAECRNIAIGHAIVALGTLTADVVRSHEVVSFVERQRMNSRPGTRKKAEAFLKKLLRGWVPTR